MPLDWNEFAELLIQVSPKPSRGRTVRMSLVRTESDYFLSKLSSQAYLRLRTVPVDRKYRLIVSDFTHEEYAGFKSDFINDIDFLRLSDEAFQSMISTASEDELLLDGFDASGAGRVSFNSKDTGWDHWKMYEELRAQSDRGLKPYVLSFRKGDLSLTVRKDLNFFVTRLERETAMWIHTIITEVLKRAKESFDNLSKFKVRQRYDQNTPPSVIPIIFSDFGAGFPAIVKSMEPEFNIRYVTKDPVDPVVMFQDRRLPGSSIRLTMRHPYVIATPEIRTNLESTLILVDSLKGMGGKRIA